MMKFTTWQKLHESFLSMKHPQSVSFQKDSPSDDTSDIQDMDMPKDDDMDDDDDMDMDDDSDLDSDDDMDMDADADADDSEDSDMDSDDDMDDDSDISLGGDTDDDMPDMGNNPPDELQDKIHKSNMKFKMGEAKKWENSFTEYTPFKEPPRLGTPEYDADFEKSLKQYGDPGERFNDGMAVGEDVLFNAPTDNSNAFFTAEEEKKPSISSWDNNWEEFLDWEKDYNK